MLGETREAGGGWGRLGEAGGGWGLLVMLGEDVGNSRPS